MYSSKAHSYLLLACVVAVLTHVDAYARVTRQASSEKRVAIMGTSYVGLVSGACLANLGHTVRCCDIDKSKIDKLNNGQVPFYEPGLEELVKKGVESGKLTFSLEVEAAIRDAELVMIAVGTPAQENGDVDLSALDLVVKRIGNNLNNSKVICIKSTVPIGTNKRVKNLLASQVPAGAEFDVVSNPEFLREGSAISDFCELNPVVIGVENEKTARFMQELYSPLIDDGISLIVTDYEAAETIKYAWNCYSATKIAYVNQIAELCNKTGADIFSVIRGMSFSEKLLPVHVLRPGPGYGGSCLPKDTQGLVSVGKNFGVDLSIVRAVVAANDSQKQKTVDLLYNLMDKNVSGKTIAILGLSFKANTDDVRYSAAIPAIHQIVRDGGIVQVYDPQAMENMKKICPEAIYCSSMRQAVDGADAIMLLTEWKEFKDIDLAWLSHIVKNRVIIDARNLFDPSELKKHGFKFVNLGRK